MPLVRITAPNSTPKSLLLAKSEKEKVLRETENVNTGLTHACLVQTSLSGSSHGPEALEHISPLSHPSPLIWDAV